MSPRYASDGTGAPIEDPRVAVAVGCRVLAAAGQSDLVLGHVSARDADGRGTWMKASGKGFEEITPADVVLIDDDGTVLEGEGRCHLEHPIHTEVLAARRDVGAVVHTHAVAPVAFSALGAELLPISHDGCLFTPPGLPRFDDTTDLIADRPLGRAVAAALDDQPAVLLVNHGIATTGVDVGAAVMVAVLLDRACHVQLLASAAGRIEHFTDRDEATSKRARVFSPTSLDGMWRYLVRRHVGDLRSGGPT